MNMGQRIIAGVTVCGIFLAVVDALVKGHEPASLAPPQPPPPLACTVGDFDVAKQEVRYIVDTTAIITGTLKSRCPARATITMLWRVENADGSFSVFSVMPGVVHIDPRQEVPIMGYATIGPNMPASRIEIINAE